MNKISIELDPAIEGHRLAIGIAIILKHEPSATIDIDKDYGECWIGDVVTTKKTLNPEELQALTDAGWEDSNGTWYLDPLKGMGFYL